MRLTCVCALVIGAIAASAGPASATSNWDYACSVDDGRVRIDVALVFNQGTAGRISVAQVEAAAHHAADDQSAADVVSFAADDIEQFWVADDAFRVAFSRYNGGDPEPVRLTIDTTCTARTCKGAYSYSRRGSTTRGSITCAVGEKG